MFPLPLHCLFLVFPLPLHCLFLVFPLPLHYLCLCFPCFCLCFHCFSLPLFVFSLLFPCLLPCVSTAWQADVWSCGIVLFALLTGGNDTALALCVPLRS